MNWIDPKVIAPKVGQTYLVLFKSTHRIKDAYSAITFIAMATVKYNRKYNGETDKHQDGIMGWSSLYTRIQIRSFNIEGSLVINKPYRRDIRNLYPLDKVIAYIPISDIDYPVELIKLKNQCDGKCDHECE